VKWKPFEFNPPDLITQVNGRINEKPWPMYAVSIKMLINWRQSMDGHPFKWRENITARSVCQIPADSKVVLTFTARDPILDWFYLRMKDKETLDRIRSWEFDYAFAVNFSHYLEMPRMEQIVNTARTLESIHFLQEAGLKVIPQVQWVDIHDRQHWADWLNREKPCAIGVNNQMLRTSLKYKDQACSWAHYTQEVTDLMDMIPKETILVMQGVSIPRRLAILKQRLGDRVAAMSGNPWCLANYGLGIQDGKRVKLPGKWDTKDLFIRNAEQLVRETYDILEKGEAGTVEDDLRAITKEKKEEEPENGEVDDLDGQGYLFDMDDLGGSASDCEGENGS
jgi:hypothetical protein